MVGRLVGASVRQRSPVGRVIVWAVAIVGPSVVAAALLPFRTSVELAGMLFCALPIVVAVAAAGGVRPALLAIVVALLEGVYLFAVPYGTLRPDVPVDLAAMGAFTIVAAAIGILVDELSRLAQEQAALRRVATLAARATTQEEVFAAVTEEVGQLLPADVTNMNRYEPDGTMTVVAGWDRGGGHVPVGTHFALGGTDLGTRVAQTGRQARMDRYEEGSGAIVEAARAVGYRSGVGTPMFVAGRLWGVMIAASTSERPLPPETEDRLIEFTDIVAAAIANSESRAELAASRARVVAASDATRRRIERDLHDGTQQRLVSLGLDLRAAEITVPIELTEVRTQLSRAANGVAEMVEELQEISRGIHPAILSKGGLGPAIKAFARRSAVPVEIDLRIERRLPERVEVAAYYVVSEALTNAAKHAHATVAQVDVSAEDAVVELSIRDDGIGGADPARGSGLTGLRDRVEALGGTIEISSPAGAGTALLVSIPIDSD